MHTKIKKKDTRKFGTSWTCLECQPSVCCESNADLIEHLKSAHAFTGDSKQVKAQMGMICHMDGSDYFSTTYEGHLLLPDTRKIKAARYTCCKRDKDDMMHWG